MNPRSVVQLFVVCLLCGCSPRLSDQYVCEYQYLQQIREAAVTRPQFAGQWDYFLVVLVDARHLNYSSPEKFLTSMRQGLFFRQDPTIGHAWIVLGGKLQGTPWYFEGGHTGEFGVTAPKYLDEVIRRSRTGHDHNPARYFLSHSLMAYCNAALEGMFRPLPWPFL